MKRILTLFILLIALLLPSCFLENTAPSTDNTDEFTLNVYDPSSAIERTLNSSNSTPFYENTFYYASRPSAVITLIPNIDIPQGSTITYFIQSSSGKIYASPFVSDENKPLARINNSSLNLFLSNFDSLSTYTVRAIYGSKSASYTFNITSSPNYPLSSSMSINYAFLNQINNDSFSITSSTDQSTVISLVADSSEITLVKDKVYSIFINDDITLNPFGRLDWSIENTTDDEGGSYFIRKSVDTDQLISSEIITTSSNERKVFLYTNNNIGSKSKITVNAGDKVSKSFFIKTINIREVDESINDIFSISSVPITDGVRILCTLKDSSLYEKYYPSISLNDAVDRINLTFDQEGVAYYDYTPSTIPYDTYTIPVKIKLITSVTSSLPLESEDKEINITIKKTPVSATLECKVKDNPNPLLASNSLRPSIPQDKIGEWLSFTNDERVALHITPINLLSLYSNDLLDEATFTVERNGIVIYSRPYLLNGYVNTNKIIYPIVSTEDSGIYRAYVKGIKGSIASSSIASVEISCIDINANVFFFPYTSTSNTQSLFKVMVCDTNLNPSDFILYIQYSTNKGNTWSDILSFDGSVVYSESSEDINSGTEITKDGSSIPFDANSENVLFRSLIVAKNENTYNIKRPTTGIKNANGEYVSTASLLITPPASVDTKTQDYYNARQITIIRPSEFYDVYYYFEKNNNGQLNNTISTELCTSLVSFGKVVEVTSYGVINELGETDSNKAVLLIGKNAIDTGVISLGSNAIITKSIDYSNSQLSPSYSYLRCDFEQCESPNLGTGCSGSDWLGTAGHGLYINKHTGFYPQFTWCGFVDKITNEGKPADGKRDYWDKSLGNSYKFWYDNAASGGCWVTGYYSKKGYLDSEMKTANRHSDTASQPSSATWKRYPLKENYKVIRQK